ncbi:MAG: HAD family hydrolase, partial [Acidithiobacillus ferriphilus]|nr:HAD family hydrolase [Acidithiobacillus ferriphilus]
QDFSAALRVLDHLGETASPAHVLQGQTAGEQVVVDIPTLQEWWADLRQG